MSIRNKFVNAIEATKNPLAPIILQEAFAHLEPLGKMMAGIADKAEVERIMNKLLSAAEAGENIEELCAKPEFIVTLTSMLSGALVAYGRKL